MNESRADDQLVADYLTGDKTALAGIYDRYADSLYDTAAAMLRDRHEAADVMQDVFLIAAERLDQLRDTTRLKPWLFAILRNQVFTKTKRRGRTRVVDFSAPEAPEMAAPIDPRADGAELAYAELADMVRSAASGLDPRDQLALEYSMRQDLNGSDLADALGVTLEQSYVIVHRMRDRVQRGLGALTVARMGRKECEELAKLLTGWDGTFSVLIRKRVARHIEDCAICEETKKRFAVLPLMSAGTALAAPPDLRDRVLGQLGHTGATPSFPYDFSGAGGFPTSVRAGRGRLGFVLAAVAAAVVLLGGGLYIGLSGGSEPADGAAVATRSTSVQIAATAQTDGAAVEASATESSSAASIEPTTTSSPITSTTSTSTTITSTSSTITSSSVAPSVAVAPPPRAPSTTAVRVTIPATTVATTSPPVVTTPPPTSVVVAPPASDPAPTTTTSIVLAAGRLDLSSGLIDLGGAASSGDLTLTNSGQQTLTWSLVASTIDPFVPSATAGALAAGQSIVVHITLDRARAPEGSLSRSAQVTSSAGGGGTVEFRAQIDHKPVVTITQGAPASFCPNFGAPTIAATVIDESALTAVQLSWTGPGKPGGTAMILSKGSWTGKLSVDTIDGTWTFTVAATDSRGNVGTAQGAAEVLC